MNRKWAIIKYAALLGLGIAVGYRYIPSVFVGISYLLLVGVALIKVLQRRLMGLFGILPYLIYTEIYNRAFIKNLVPYLTLQYFFLAAFGIMILNGGIKGKPHSKAMYLMLAFLILEIINGFYTHRVDLLRATIINTAALFVIILWSSYNVLTPPYINRLLDNVKYASMYLAGIVLVAHLQGKIQYSSFSSSEASNGLAPVQLSGYFGVGVVLFFLSLMNPEDKKYRLINLGAMSFVLVIMLLTLSRGGLYFFATTVALYIFYNRSKMQNYFKFIFVIPIGFWVYNFVVQETGGAIVKRYEEKGASNREVLVEKGFQLFMDDPIIGVGTGNFGWAIKHRGYFGVDSGAHNEFVRAAAEHGIFGIFTYWGFFIVLLSEVLKRRQPNRQYAVYFLVLFCLITVHNGLKISVQHVLMMLTIATPVITNPKKVIRLAQPAAKKQLA